MCESGKQFYSFSRDLKTLIEYALDSQEAEIYQKLAEAIIEDDSRIISTHISDFTELRRYNIVC